MDATNPGFTPFNPGYIQSAKPLFGFVDFVTDDAANRCSTDRPSRTATCKDGTRNAADGRAGSRVLTLP